MERRRNPVPEHSRPPRPRRQQADSSSMDEEGTVDDSDVNMHAEDDDCRGADDDHWAVETEEDDDDVHGGPEDEEDEDEEDEYEEDDYDDEHGNIEHDIYPDTTTDNDDRSGREDNSGRDSRSPAAADARSGLTAAAAAVSHSLHSVKEGASATNSFLASALGLGAAGGSGTALTLRCRSILSQLRCASDLSVQMIALQDLAELLSVSTEDSLAGHFQPDLFVTELVKILRGDSGPDGFSTMTDSSEMMLLACRCLSNMIEALPSAVGIIVYNGVVPILVSKLLEIQYIDLAEQALTALQRISVEYPNAVIRAGGLQAVLSYLDFFATNIQRIAVQTAANCTKGVDTDSFDMCIVIMPNLENLLSYSDQKVVEYASTCLDRIIDGFKQHKSLLEKLVSKDFLRSIHATIAPPASSTVTSTTFLALTKCLTNLAYASPNMTSYLLQFNIVDTIFFVLTGGPIPRDRHQIPAMLSQSILTTWSTGEISEILELATELLPALPERE